MEDYIISPDLLKEMQQDGLIDPISDEVEPRPQPLPSNTILSDTKKMINNQINNKKIINHNQSSLIPEVSESQENAESVSFNYNSSSIGHINNKKEKKYYKQMNKNNSIENQNYIKEEEQEEENIQDVINNNEYESNKNNNYIINHNEDEEDIEIESNKDKNEQNKSQSSFTSFGRAKSEFVNTSISTVGIEPLYYHTNNNNFHNVSLTPINQNKKKINFNDMKMKNYKKIANDKIVKQNIQVKDIKNIKMLQNELNTLSKQFEKIDKNLKSKNSELKKLKLINESLLKENNNQKKLIESLNNENVMLNSKIIGLKDYNNKMEKKLLSGSKNHHIIEINNKLRQENESLTYEIKYKENENKELIKQKNILNDEINILKKEFQSSLEINNKGVINNDKISKIITELTQEKKKIIKYEEELDILKKEINKKELILQKTEEEIQSLNYAKTQMTTIIAHKENEIHNLTIERDSFQQHFQDCNNQLRTLKQKMKDYDNIKKDKIEYEQRLLSLSDKQGNKAKELTEQYEYLIKKYLNEINVLKNENIELNNKINEFENEKNNNLKEYNIAVNDKNKYNELFNNLVNKLNEDVNENINKNKENKELFNKLDYEKEKNLKLIYEIEPLIN